MLSEKLASLVLRASDDYTCDRPCSVSKEELRECADEVRELREAVRAIRLPEVKLPSAFYKKVKQAKQEVTSPSVGFRLYLIEKQSAVIDTIRDAQDFGDPIKWERDA